MTFPAHGSDAVFNLVVRGLAFRSGHLLVSQWAGGYSFPIGGRLEHGESLESGMRREFREETGIEPVVRKMVYFHENFFIDAGGRATHELGWYFWVEAEDLPGDVAEVRPHPDHGDLRLRYVPVDRLAEADSRPRFLIEAVPHDYRACFPDGLRCYQTREAWPEDPPEPA